MKSFWQKNKFYIFALIVLLIFEIFFHQKIYEFIINSKYPSLLSNINSSPIKDCSFFILALLYMYINYILQHLSSRLIILLSPLCLHYIICRIFFTNHFTFTETYYFHQISYLDILPIFFFVSLISTFIYHQAKNDCNEVVRNDIHSSLTNFEDDKFNRVLFAKNFVTAFKQSSKTIYGIEGDWGSGKTTILNFIRILLKEEAIVIDFNPWFCLDKKQIVPEFFSLLRNKLNSLDIKGIADLQFKLKKYTSLLAADYSKIINSYIFSEDSRKNEFDTINNLLKGLDLDKPIFVLIDDIDRLEDSQVIECLKLIKLLAHFDSINFIVAYDKKHILKAMEKYQFDIKYADKVFPQEIHLPEIGSNKLAGYLIELVKEELQEKDIIILERHIDNLLEVLDVQFETIREVLKVYSSFITSHSFLKDKVLVDELLVVEILRSKNIYFGVYKDLFNMKGNIVSYTTKNGTSNLLYLKEGYEAILEDQFNIKDYEKRQVSCLLKYLFTNFRNKSNKPLRYSSAVTYSDGDGHEINYDWDARSIRHEYSSRIYFTLGLDDLQIEPNEIINFLEGSWSNEELEQKLKNYTSESKIVDFINLLRNKSMFDFELAYKNFILTICLLAEQAKLGYEEEFLAKILLDMLPESHRSSDEHSKYQYVFDYLESMITKFEERNQCYLFIMKLIYRGAVYVNKQTWFSTKDQIKEKVDNLFLNYLKSEMKDGDYFLRMTNLVKEVYYGILEQQSFEIQHYLKEILEKDKELFRAFLRVSIYNENKLENKTIWPRWYSRFAYLAKDGIMPIFQGKVDFKNFIDSVEPWKNERFVERYKEFIEKSFSGNESIEFDIDDLND